MHSNVKIIMVYFLLLSPANNLILHSEDADVPYPESLNETIDYVFDLSSHAFPLIYEHNMNQAKKLKALDMDELHPQDTSPRNDLLVRDAWIKIADVHPSVWAVDFYWLPPEGKILIVGGYSLANSKTDTDKSMKKIYKLKSYDVKLRLSILKGSRLVTSIDLPSNALNSYVDYNIKETDIGNQNILFQAELQIHTKLEIKTYKRRCEESCYWELYGEENIEKALAIRDQINGKIYIISPKSAVLKIIPNGKELLYKTKIIFESSIPTDGFSISDGKRSMIFQNAYDFYSSESFSLNSKQGKIDFVRLNVFTSNYIPFPVQGIDSIQLLREEHIKKSPVISTYRIELLSALPIDNLTFRVNGLVGDHEIQPVVYSSKPTLLEIKSRRESGKVFAIIHLGELDYEDKTGEWKSRGIPDEYIEITINGDSVSAKTDRDGNVHFSFLTGTSTILDVKYETWDGEYQDSHVRFFLSRELLPPFINFLIFILVATFFLILYVGFRKLTGGSPELDWRF
jgi:hypothetical protein